MKSSELVVSRVRDKNIATKLVSQAPIKLIPTAAIKDEFRVMTSSYGGGILQGDQVSMKVECQAHSSLLLQSQGNQHLYKCNKKDKRAYQYIEGHLAYGAKAMVLPEPTVLHQDADFYQSQEWNCESGSNLLLLDYIHIGRSENGESFSYKAFQSDICLKVDHEKVYLDRYLSVPKHNYIDLSSKFGSYKLMLNILSFGSDAVDLHQKIAEEFDSSEVARFGELSHQKNKHPPGYFMASCFDKESKVMTSRALFEKRKQIDPMIKMIELNNFF